MGKGAGKGEGKGGDDCFCSGLMDNIQAMFSCLVCLLCSGPVLIIIGLCFLASTTNNTRKHRIDAFNGYLNSWEASGNGVNTRAGFANAHFYAVWSAANNNGNTCPVAGKQGNLTLVSSNLPQDKIGTDSKIRQYMQFKFGTDLANSGIPASAFNEKCVLSVSVHQTHGSSDTVVGTLSSPVAQHQTLTNTQFCNTSGKKAKSSCQSQCQDNYNGVFQSSGSTYTCQVKQRVTTMCMRVSGDSNGVYTAATQGPGGASGGGCDVAQSGSLNFIQNQLSYTSGPIDGSQTWSFFVLVRDINDPYIDFIVATNGDKTFGLTTGQKVAIGLSCLLVGLCLASCWVLACVYGCRYFCGGKGSQHPPPQNPFAKPIYHTAQSWGYVQPPPGYPTAYGGGQASNLPQPGAYGGAYTPPPGYPAQGAAYSAPTAAYQPSGAPPPYQPPPAAYPQQQAAYQQPASGYYPPQASAGYTPNSYPPPYNGQSVTGYPVDNPAKI